MRNKLVLQRLAIKVIEDDDREAATVLGDAMLELGLDRFYTGRVRLVPFYLIATEFFSLVSSVLPMRANTVRERYVLRFTVLGREVLYNVELYAAHPGEAKWNAIWSQLVTTRRDIFRGMRQLPGWNTEIRFSDLFWEQRFGGPYEFSQNVSLRVRTGARGQQLKKERLTPIAVVERLDRSSNPADPYVPRPKLPARDPRRATRTDL